MIQQRSARAGRRVRRAKLSEPARDVAEFAAGSEQAQNGFIEQLFNQVVKQPMLAYGPDVMDRLRRSFVASDFNIQRLLVEMATISALHGTEKTVRAKTERKVADAGPK